MGDRRAVRRALAIRRELGIVGVATAEEVDRAIVAAGVRRWPDDAMPDRLYGAYYRGVIRVRRGLLPGTATYVAAHELGHAVCGHARGAYEAPLAGGAPPEEAAEEEAHLFAFGLMLGRPARTTGGLDGQLHAGCEAGLPLPMLFEVVNVLARAARPTLAPPAPAQGELGAELLDQVDWGQAPLGRGRRDLGVDLLDQVQHAHAHVAPPRPAAAGAGLFVSVHWGAEHIEFDRCCQGMRSG